MSFGTTEGDLDGEIEYEPFIPRSPRSPSHHAGAHRAAPHRRDGSGSGPAEPLPPPMPPQPTPAPKSRSTKRAAVLGGVAGAVIAALVVGGVAVTRRQLFASAPHRARPRRHVSGSGPAVDPRRPPGPSTPRRSPSGVAPTMDIRAVLRKVEPSVVAIETNPVSQNGGLFGRGAGTGVIISDDGLVLTNNHVIEGADSIKVKLFDGRELNADLVGSSPADDVALVKIRDVSGLTAAELGSSADLQVGDPVVAIGNALDLEGTPTVTQGIVSALNRSIDAGNEESGVVESHPDRRGDQPGQLGRSARELVGSGRRHRHGDRRRAQNIGFAIAIDGIKPLLADLKNGGGSVRGTAFLGVSSVGISDLDQATLDQYGIKVTDGAVVDQVTPSTRAADARPAAGRRDHERRRHRDQDAGRSRHRDPQAPARRRDQGRVAAQR